MAAVPPVNITALRDDAGHPVYLVERSCKGMAVKWIARQGLHTDNKIVPTRGGDAYFHAKLILLMNLALGNAFNFRRMDAVQLVPISLLLIKHALRQLELFVKLRMQIGIIQDIAQNVPIHPAQVAL